MVKETKKQEQYKDVLQRRLLLHLREWFPKGESFVFIQDGERCPAARLIKAFLQQENVHLIPWPGNSPDMNLIENVWELVKREARKDAITTKV